MTTILGIDAAWTSGEPSGVALVQCQTSRWRCVAVAPSYAAFMALAEGHAPDWSRTATGSAPDASGLLQAAKALACEDVTLVTIDMPVATIPILRRRAADQAVSRSFGARWCSAHSPGPARPGSLGAELSRQFAKQDYSVATTATPVGTTKRLVEVYPHPALLTLLNRERRVPYKVSKSSTYWEGASISERISHLLNEFETIRRGLEQHIDGLATRLPRANDVKTLSALKPFEDALDALVCCWVGGAYLAGTAYPLGDTTAAVWCPGL
jgi:predicted RNase H-like nuclease